jgi:ribosomal protein S18 acetylase RimI-like enzyme
MNTFSIRKYQPADQAAVLAIAADTAFFGDPVEAFLEDRNLHADAFARYYIEHETAYLWVAENPAGVVGFLLGCANTARQTRLWRRYIISQVLVKALSGRYKLGRRTASFAWGMLTGSMRGEDPKINLREYPAHLQIDVQQGYRSMGVGKGLIEAYLEQLRSLAVIGVHLETTSHNEAACYLYEKVGFKLLDRRPNRYWTTWFGYGVDNLAYGMKLSQ